MNANSKFRPNYQTLATINPVDTAVPFDASLGLIDDGQEAWLGSDWSFNIKEFIQDTNKYRRYL